MHAIRPMISPCKILDDHVFNQPRREAVRANPQIYRCGKCGRTYWEIMGVEPRMMQSKKDA